MSMFWYIFFCVILALIAGLYVALSLLVRGGFTTVLEDVANSPIPMSLPQKEAFDQSLRRVERTSHSGQGWLLVFATLILVVFDSRPFIIAAMFCVCLAVWHFYRARHIYI